MSVGYFLPPTLIEYFNHKRILEFEPIARPFSSLDEMNETIINNWNNLVKPEDTVYHLGDVALGPKEEIPKIIPRLMGRKVLVIGNHDLQKGGAKAMLAAGFDEVHDELWLTINGVNLYMHHQPMPKEKWASADYHLCGHVHSRWRRKGDIINVGVDVWELTPRTLEELLEAEDEGEYVPEIDNH